MSNRIRFTTTEYATTAGSGELRPGSFKEGQTGTVHGSSLQGLSLKDALRSLKYVRVKVDGTKEWIPVDVMHLQPLNEED